MQTVKDGIFTFLGRPKFYDDDFGKPRRPKYESPQDTDLDEIYFEEEDLFDAALIEEIVVLPF